MFGSAGLARNAAQSGRIRTVGNGVGMAWIRCSDLIRNGIPPLLTARIHSPPRPLRNGAWPLARTLAGLSDTGGITQTGPGSNPGRDPIRLKRTRP